METSSNEMWDVFSNVQQIILFYKYRLFWHTKKKNHDDDVDEEEDRNSKFFH